VYDLIRDLKHTFRRLARTPVFTLAIVPRTHCSSDRAFGL